LSDITYVTKEVHDSIYARCPVEKDDVLYIKDGVTTGIAVNNHLDEPFSMLSSVALLKPVREIIDPAYLKHWLNSPETFAAMVGQMSGSAIRRLTLTTINGQTLPLPPLPEQRRIVAKLDSLRARSARAREELDRIPKLIERYKQAILAKAFSGELTADWRATHGSDEWEEATVEAVSETIFDGPFGSHLKSDDYVDAGVRVVRLENIGHLEFKADKQTFVSEEKYNQLLRHTLKPDDVIFSSFVDEEIRVCLFPTGLDAPAINKADCFAIRVDGGRCSAKWLTYRLACRSTYETLKGAVHGATRPRINLGTLKALELELPEMAEQDEIIRRIEHAFAWLDKIAAEHASAARLLPRLDQAILAKAFRGELVPQDPTDEPASALVERIKAERESGQRSPRRTPKRK
jgi:type I restriction enzyme S subunit